MRLFFKKRKWPVIGIVAGLFLIPFFLILSSANAGGGPPAITLTLLSVYQSSNADAGTGGTPICTSVSLTGASECTGTLVHGTTYRFEVTVSETNNVNYDLSSHDFQNAVGSGDVLGTVTTAEFTAARCASTIVGTPSIVSSITARGSGYSGGTKCTIKNTTAIVTWLITIDTDAVDGQATATFFATDGSVSDASTLTTFNVAPPTPTVTLGAASGSDPATTTVAPESGIRDAGAFSFVIDSGTDNITALDVSLAGGGTPYDGLSEVRVTSNDGSTTYFSAISSPSSNSLSFSGGTAIPVSTGATTFKIRVTPKSHAAMDSPPGASYDLSPTVSDFTSQGSYTKAGSDTNANTLTVDNEAPTTATGDSASAGNAQVTLNWTTSASSDYNSTVILRWAASSPGSEIPAEGQTYTVDDSITTATVACVETTGTASNAESGVDGAGTGGCSAVALTNDQDYSYIAFSLDDYGNYDSDSPLTFSDNPLTPVAGSLNVTASSSNSFAPGLEVAFTSQTSTMSNVGAIQVVDDRGGSPGWTLNLTGNDWKSGEDVMQLDYAGTGSDNDLGKLCVFPADATLYAESGSLTGVTAGTNDCFGAAVSTIDLVTATAGNGTGTYWLTDMSLGQYIPSNPTAQEYTTTIIFSVQ